MAKRRPKNKAVAVSRRRSWPAKIALSLVILASIYAAEFGYLGAQDTPYLFNYVPDHPFQFVVFSFDGSKSLDKWRDTRRFAEEMSAAGKPIHFTYFVSGVYFLTDEDRALYNPPRHPTGASAIGFGDSREDVALRLAEMVAAAAEGHEIASHAVGHFDGSRWSAADWLSELSQFKKILLSAAVAADLAAPVAAIAQKMDGFRAPELGMSQELIVALGQLGYEYDASKIAASSQSWPAKEPNGLWQFPLAPITAGGKKTISMDYNLYALQTGSKDLVKKGAPRWGDLFNETYSAYMRYFETNYRGTRAPVFIGHHFSDWNDGLYYEVLKKVAEDVCGLAEVRCVSFRELRHRLDGNPLFAAGHELGR